MRLKPVVIAGLIVLSVTVLVGCQGVRAARLYQSGTQALNAGLGDLAVAQLREANRLKPDTSEIQNHLGLAYSVTGQPARALAAFERAVDLDCSNAAAVKNLAAARAAAAAQREPSSTESAGGS